jgi:hypothetical protein
VPARNNRTTLSGAKLRGQRRRAQRPALAAIALLGLLLGGVSAGLVGYVSAVAGAAVDDAFDDVPVSERVFQLSARVADDPASQDSTAIDAFDRFVGEAPYDLQRSLLTEPRQLVDPATPEAEGADEGLPRIALAAYDSLAEHAELVAGEWPSDVADGELVPVALHENSASALGIELGDELAFVERQQVARLVVTGLWRPADPAADYWFGSELEAAGVGNGDGLAVLAEADLLELPGPVPIARWRLLPDVEQVRVTDLSELRLGLPLVRPYLADHELFRDAGIGVADDIIAGLEGTDNELLASRSVAIAPLLLAVASAVGAIGLVSRLLGQNRLGETMLLRGRGWSRPQAAWWALRESVRLFALPALLGGAAGYGVLRLIGGPDLDVPIPAVATGAGVVVLTGILTLMVAAAGAAGPAYVTVDQRATASRRQVVGRVSGVVLVVAAAALATWQLRRYDGVTVLDADGIRQLDPLAVAAPAAILLAGGVVVAGIMIVLGRVVEWFLRRRRGLAGLQAVRVLARQPAAYVLPVVLIALAAGSGTLAVTYSATWHDLQGQVAASRAAADVDVTLPGSGLLTQAHRPLNLADYRDIPGVTGVAASSARSARISDGEVDVVATAGVAEPPGIELPEGDQSADVELAIDLQISEPDLDALGDFESPAPPGQVDGRIRWWLTDAAGNGTVVDTEQVTFPVGAPSTVTAPLALPDGGAEPWRIISADVTLELPALPTRQADFSLAISGVGAAAIPADGWTAFTTRTPDAIHLAVSTSGDAAAGLTGFLAYFSGELTTRIVHTAGPVPVTAGDAALDRFGLAVGDVAALDMLGTAVDVEITGRAAAVGGAARPEAFGADIHHLVAAALSQNQQPPVPTRIWLTMDPDANADAVLDEVAMLAPPDSTIAGRAAVEQELVDARLAQLIITTFWAVGGVAAGLAIIGVAAGAASALSSRRGEVGVLRVLGFSSRQQGRQRLREQLLVSLLAVVLGSAAGYAVGVLTLPALTGSATADLPDGAVPSITVNAPVLAVLLGVLAMVITLIVAGHARRVRRQAQLTFGTEVSA